MTRIEQWITNPYAIFARHILKLDPLPELGREPDAAMRGQIIHMALHQFSKLHEIELPRNTGEILTQLGHESMDRLGEHPRIMAFWKPQFARFADWFGETEPARRTDLARHFPEREGRMSFDSEGGGGEFILTARADRIDLKSDGSLIIYDYKSSAKNPAEVRSMKSPQLPLEGAIAASGGFADMGAVPATDLMFISATGREERGQEISCINKDHSAVELANDALAGLKMLVAQYDLPEVGYPALRRTGFSYTYDDFEHLARVKEWAVEDFKKRVEEIFPMSARKQSINKAVAETTALQARAAEPSGSRWVSANAGTGKTKVLVDRVLRLLLSGRHSPIPFYASPIPMRRQLKWKTVCSSKLSSMGRYEPR